MNVPAAGTQMIVLPGGGYAEHAAHEAEPVARWLCEIGVQASMFRYPLNVRHPVPLDALREEIGRREAAGAQRIGLIGFSAGGHLAGAGRAGARRRVRSDSAVRCAWLRHDLDGDRLDHHQPSTTPVKPWATSVRRSYWFVFHQRTMTPAKANMVTPAHPPMSKSGNAMDPM
jgi:hypothetical protein